MGVGDPQETSDLRGRIGSVRSAALSARARQLTPQAREREDVRVPRYSLRKAAYRRPKSYLALAASCAAAVLLPAVASAASASSGGVRAPARPKVDDVVCISRCVSGHQATPGATVKVKGAFLDRVTKVVFRGKDGPLRARYKSRDLKRAKAVVPKGAIDSRPYVIDSRGNVSNRSRHKLGDPPSERDPGGGLPRTGLAQLRQRRLAFRRRAERPHPPGPGHRRRLRDEAGLGPQGAGSLPGV